MDIDKILTFHSKNKGKIKIEVASKIENKEDLSLAYTPGVAEVSKAIAKNPEKIFDYTIKSHTVAIVSDGSAVLGLGNIGAEAAIPVMEGKAALFKTFAGLDAFPICLKTQVPSEIINIVKNISPVFGGINLEDISAPRCFEIENALQDLGIPVMHDDQHGTSVVVLAGLINAAKVVGKKLEDLTVVVNGAGAAGNAISKLLSEKVKNVIVVDSRGIVSTDRAGLDPYKKLLTEVTNKNNLSGGLKDAMKNADVFIGVSKANLLTSADIKLMNKGAIVFAMANPVPEIMPEEAKKGGAAIVATGRSDMPNQVNNSLAFPGIFKGALEIRAKKITKEMKIAAAEALAKLVENPTAEKIVPGPFDEGVAETVGHAVKESAST
ncbi:MAG: Malate dehydrogenase (Oxaloacetate-decarboxylating) [Candidatus Woesebacteria bacterium GW2011_GWA2_40_7]|uniref:Malate dehydrogenase (Oxaloacetate-decarboxylating) n=3 Tax=Candidatus Woeseibacteriota TaxID=1752722 RepID=A0A0G0XWK9_9BACT|nr:MAG: Malate dehydrogenase (Oxaloacetate-decarboxylating) [Candidatus Woesebacteria bacterium GW2011_GWB1_39_10]KKR72215.1 MAG: Malate dehydrogenase (Oxaloacetate-decarboxylating) [Candidatus Woesebacteria bacterium GW2011_GWA2_40_7]KKR92277.1 MAG: Malate dehydrogenase (Oxaloacetate-decarboxylating) [Candidatus Woesebacteria bacterium GW2011_GWA1_41_13b]